MRKIYGFGSYGYVVFADSDHVFHCTGHRRAHFPKSIREQVAIVAVHTHKKGELNISSTINGKFFPVKIVIFRNTSEQRMKSHPNFANRHQMRIVMSGENFALVARGERPGQQGVRNAYPKRLQR